VFYTIFRNKPGQRVFLTSGLGSMGYGLPTAIGACLANDKKPMVAIESDGSLQLNLQEFATLVAQQLPITLVIMNNGGYASIRNTQRNYFASRFVGTGPEAGLMLPDLESCCNLRPAISAHQRCRYIARAGRFPAPSRPPPDRSDADTGRNA